MDKPKIRTNQLLVIGIDEYKENIYSNLNNSLFDCNAVVKELTENYGFNLIEEPIYNELATRRNILDKLSSLQYLTMEEDNLIIYYAGHGQINPVTNKGSWIPYDASESSSDYIPNSTLKDADSHLQCIKLLLSEFSRA